MQVKIYHNPRCSKSRQTLQILRGRNIEPEIVEYLKCPPSPEELRSLLSKLGVGPRQLMRTKEEAYLTEHLDDGSLTDDQLIEAMTRHPILIERPIVLANETARIGRPPEQVLEIL